jgi:hypothetical protein
VGLRPSVDCLTPEAEELPVGVGEEPLWHRVSWRQRREFGWNDQ